MPQVTETFSVDQPADAVWDFLQDVPQVVTCMPGLELLDQPSPNTYRGKIRVKLGPVSAAFEGEATIVETDEAAHRARIESKGADKRGGSRATAAVTYWLTGDDGTATVHIEGDIKLTGALAQLGRTGIVADVASHLIAQFADALRNKLAAQAPAVQPTAAAPAETPASGGTGEPAAFRAEGLVFRLLWRRLTRLFGFVLRPFARRTS